MFDNKNVRWFGLLFLLMLGLRIGYKYYRTQQKPTSEVMMEKAQARSQALMKAIQADQDAQRANGATAIVADSAVLAADTALQAR